MKLDVDNNFMYIYILLSKNGLLWQSLQYIV